MTTAQRLIIISFLIGHFHLSASGATPGLPLTEDFSSTDLRDATRTHASWSTREEVLLLNSRGPLYGVFGSGLVGVDITAEEHDTSSLALGDMDGDGDLDLVEGNRNEPCRLYFNDGFVFKGTVPSGFDMTFDARDTRSVAVGDVDGDGDLDLVTGNFTGANRLYLNNGSLNPFPATIGSNITADADDTASVALGDLDGDGDLDLVAGNNGTPNRLYLNNGTADPFAGVTGLAITSDASATNSVALGDLDSDGDLDLVVANFQQPSAVYLNNGTDDPFAGATGAEFAPNSSEIEPSVALGDMNGDGHLDIVKVGGELVEFDQIYFNNGTANPFDGVTGVPFNSDEDLSFSVAVGDVDCDGDLDVIIGNTGLFSEGGRNRLYLNNGTSDPFAGVTGTNLSEDIHHSVALALGDVDEDGDLDVVAGNRNQRNRLYRNEGSIALFDPTSSSDISSDDFWTFSMVLGDVDGDGDLDFIAENDNVGTVHIYLNNGTPDPFLGVMGSTITMDTNAPVSMALGDVDGDGDLDLVAGSFFFTTRLYLNNGTGMPFAGITGSDITSASGTTSVALGDMDNDGDLDVVVGRQTFSNLRNHRLFLNNGTADPFNGAEPIEILSENDRTQSIALGDMDGDGDLDLVTGGPDGVNRLYLNNGSRNPFEGQPGEEITPDTNTTKVVTLGDVDGDGDLDFVAGNLEGEPNRLYLNNGTSDPFLGVEGKDITSDSTESSSLALRDVDGDGDLDLVVGSFQGHNRIYLNNGTSDPFDNASGLAYTMGAVSSIMAVGDMDGDGDPDIVRGTSFGTNQLHLNRKASVPLGELKTLNITMDVQPTRSIAVGDIDRDGDPDLVAGNSGQPSRLYLNNGKLDPFNGVTGSDITSDARQTSSVALADLDKDGDLDLVTGNSGQTNRYYPNLGGPDPFGTTVGSDISSDAHSTTSIALGDVDRDGDEDLAAGNFGQTNRLYLNNGTSDPWQSVIVEEITEDAHNTNSVALADVDRDGFLDLVAGNAGQPNRLYLNQMDVGPFSAGREINSATGATISMAIGDVDGDNDLDLIVAKGVIEPPGLPATLYLNNGTADPFAGVAGVNVTPENSRVFSLALGDVDGDEDLDLITNSLDQPMQFYPNNGTSAPFDGVAPVNITSENQTASQAVIAVALGDMDGDEDLDIVAGGQSFSARLFLNNGTNDPFAGVAGGDITSDTGITVSLALADFNGDGALDVAVGHRFFKERNRLFLNNGTINPFAGVVGSDIGSESNFTGELAADDFNGDNRPDIVTANSTSPSFLYLNNGTASPFEGVSGVAINSTTLDTVGSISVGDMDGDGDVDVVLGVNAFDVSNRLFLNNGGPDPFDGVVGIEIDSKLVSRTERLGMGDMDGDGDLDLLVGKNFIPVELSLNNQIPNPYLSGIDITTDAHNTNSVALADVDVDGDLDLVAGNFNQPNRLYLNNGTEDPFFDAIGIEAGAGVRNTEEVALADIDRNGRPDLLTANLGQPNRVFLNFDNQVALPFVGVEGIDISSDAENTRSILAADMDRDGLLDIVVGNDGQVNRLYTQHRFKTGPSFATSLTVDTKPDDIHRILLDVEETLPPNTRIDYFISANGGARWSQVQPSRTFPLPMLGSDLKWRAVLKSLSPRFSPRLNTLFLDLGPGLKSDPASINFGDRVPNIGPSDPVTVSIMNEDEVTLTISSVLLGGLNAGEFVFSNDTGEINLSPGGTRTFDVAFNPTSPGDKTATVTIASDDIDRPNLVVPLAGRGADPPTPTPTASPTETPVDETTPTPTMTTEYDIQPDPTDGFVDARDLIEWLNRIDNDDLPASAPEDLLFDFSLHWKR